MSPVARIIVAIIRLWQKTLSPDRGKFRFLYFSPLISLSIPTKPGCRFYPSCSEYAIEALERYSLGQALTRSFKRISRCHPLSKTKT